MTGLLPNPLDQLVAQPELHTPAQSSETRIALGHAEALLYAPTSIRNDEATGEPAVPLLFAQGLNREAGLPYMMKHLAKEDQR